MRVSTHCFAVIGLGYLPPWTVNAGFIAGERLTLVVDTGANALAAATIHGYASAVRSTNELMVINTEKHFDHVGGNAYFRERGIDVYGHAGIERTNVEFAAELAEFHGRIADPVRRARSEEDVFYRGTRVANPNRRIREEMEIDLGGCTAWILMTPGHTETNLSVWIPEDGVIFSGDCVVNGYLPNLDCGTKAYWEQWLRSLDRIARLSPKAIVPGHGAVATGPEADRALREVRGVLEQSIAAA